MRLFRRLNCQVRSGEQTGAVFERVRQLVREMRPTEQPVLFVAEDLGGQCVSGIERMKRQFPELAEYESTRERLLVHGERVVQWQALSNVSPGWPESGPPGPPPPLDPGVLAAIADGIPRRFPVATAAFLFDAIDWTHTGNDLPGAIRCPATGRWWDDYLSSSVRLRSDGGTSGRVLWLDATVEIDPPAADATEAPALDGATRERLRRLGDVLTEELIAAPSEDERVRLVPVAAEAERLVEAERRRLEPSQWDGALSSLGRASRRGLVKLSLPHRLGAYEKAVPGKASFKPTLIGVFGPRGYAYASALHAPNTYVFVKRTPAYHRIRLTFSSGVRGSVLACWCVCEGPFCRHRLTLYCSPWQLQAEYPVVNQDILGKAAANYGIVVDHLETALVPTLDGLYGPAPKWFEYEGDRLT
jgi:hypothetical protein